MHRTVRACLHTSNSSHVITFYAYRLCHEILFAEMSTHINLYRFWDYRRGMNARLPAPRSFKAIHRVFSSLSLAQNFFFPLQNNVDRGVKTLGSLSRRAPRVDRRIKPRRRAGVFTRAHDFQNREEEGRQGRKHSESKLQNFKAESIERDPVL